MPDAAASAERLVLTTPRRSLAFALAACAAFLALGLWFLGGNDDLVMGAWSWIGILFLGAGVVMALAGLRRPPQLILTPEGFTLTGALGVGPIPWRDVDCFFIYAGSATDEANLNNPHAAWVLKPGSTHAQGWVSKINRAGDMGMDGALPRNIGMEPEPLAELMENWRVRYG